MYDAACIFCYKTNFNRVRSVVKTLHKQYNLGQTKHRENAPHSTKPACVTESSTELDESYISLFKYIRTDIIPNITNVRVTSLTAELLPFVKSSEISESMRNIHRRLQTGFKDSVHIFPDDKERLLMVADSVTLQDVVLEIQCVLRELDSWK